MIASFKIIKVKMVRANTTMIRVEVTINFALLNPSFSDSWILGKSVIGTMKKLEIINQKNCIKIWKWEIFIFKAQQWCKPVKWWSRVVLLPYSFIFASWDWTGSSFTYTVQFTFRAGIRHSTLGLTYFKWLRL